MLRLQFILFQIDEAKRYVLDASLPGLRVALMLLDNAAEVLLDRWIEEDLDHDAMFETLAVRGREVGIPENHPQFVDFYQQRFLTAKEKRNVARLFDEKVRYVTEVKPNVAPSIGKVLSHLHRYRNEAYHSGRVRADTVRTAAMIHLELCCRLIHALKPGSMGYSSSEDFGWLESRFKLKVHDLWNDRTMAALLATFRDGIPIGDAGLRETLTKNLESRLEDLNERLEFISTETRVAADCEGALAESQRFALAEIKRSAPYRGAPSGIDEPVSGRQIEGLGHVPDRIKRSADSLTGFEIYAEADTELERIEFMVERLAGAIEAQIQLQVDLARGK